jgi:DNA-binding NtrC family response regulator
MLLRVLSEGELVPVGDTRVRSVNVRVIAATNRDLVKEVETGNFREDLYFRLSVVHVELPPLRERREDILLLAENFLEQYARKYAKPVRELPGSVARELEAYDWPGNVRALRHSCERAVILSDGDAYRTEDFSLAHRNSAPVPAAPPPAAGPAADEPDNLNLERAEKQMVEQALKKHHYNISLAAQELGLTRASLYRRMDKHGL